jgi:predicted Zn-dependent protease
LFADWPAELWYRARVRQLARAGRYDAATLTVRDAAAGGMTTLAQELAAILESERRVRALEIAGRARVAFEAGRMAEARNILLMAVRTAPEEGALWVLLGDTRRALGDEQGALQAAAQALTLGDSSVRADARGIQGLVAMEHGRAREAAELFSESTRLAPRYEQTWLWRAEALCAAGDTAAAAGVCRRGIAAAQPSTRLQALLRQLAPRR